MVFRYFGTGESFVWRLDEESELPVFYPWVGNNNENPDTCPQMFMAANDRLIVVRLFFGYDLLYRATFFNNCLSSDWFRGRRCYSNRRRTHPRHVISLSYIRKPRPCSRTHIWHRRTRNLRRLDRNLIFYTYFGDPPGDFLVQFTSNKCTHRPRVCSTILFKVPWPYDAHSHLPMFQFSLQANNCI